MICGSSPSPPAAKRATSSTACNAAWSPTIGSRCRASAPACEIRGRDEAGAFRAIYVAAFAEAVYVLHAFGKRTQRTAKRDLDLAAAGLRQIGKEGAG